MPFATPSVPSATAARNAAPAPSAPLVQKAERSDSVRESWAISAADRASAVAPEPHWAAAIDAATD